MVIAAFVLSAASIYGKRLSQRFDAVMMTGAQLAIGGAILLLVGQAAGGTLSHWSWEAVALMAYMVLLSAVAFSLWTVLLKHNPVSLVAVFNFLIPVFGAALSAIFLGESVLEWKNLLALVLVCGGIAMVTRAVGAAARQPTDAPAAPSASGSSISSQPTSRAPRGW